MEFSHVYPKSHSASPTFIPLFIVIYKCNPPTFLNTKKNTYFPTKTLLNSLNHVEISQKLLNFHSKIGKNPCSPTQNHQKSDKNMQKQTPKKGV